VLILKEIKLLKMNTYISAYSKGLKRESVHWDIVASDRILLYMLPREYSTGQAKSVSG